MKIITVPLDIWQGHDPETKCDKRKLPIKYIVLHTTGGVDSRIWLSKWNRENPNSQQNNVSIHYLIAEDGTIYSIIGEDKRAWHVGICEMPDGSVDGNSAALGIEIEHLSGPYYPEVQLDAAAELTHYLMQRYNLPDTSVVSHASVARPVGRKIDPVNFDWADFWNRISKITEVTKPDSYSAKSPLVHTPVLDENKLLEYVSTKKSKFAEYTQQDIHLISSYYLKYGKQTGIDWIIALAQSIHETGWFMSWWAARPRRNPAGIGVTGRVLFTRPQDPQNWVFDRYLWRRGQSFDSWDISVQHHISRLLCYALRDEEMTPLQLNFADISGARSLSRVRGCAPKLRGLNGVWAVPGKQYAQKIAELANSFVRAIQ